MLRRNSITPTVEEQVQIVNGTLLGPLPKVQARTSLKVDPQVQRNQDLKNDLRQKCIKQIPRMETLMIQFDIQQIAYAFNVPTDAVRKLLRGMSGIYSMNTKTLQSLLAGFNVKQSELDRKTQEASGLSDNAVNIYVKARGGFVPSKMDSDLFNGGVLNLQHRGALLDFVDQNSPDALIKALRTHISGLKTTRTNIRRYRIGDNKLIEDLGNPDVKYGKHVRHMLQIMASTIIEANQNPINYIAEQPVESDYTRDEVKAEVKAEVKVEVEVKQMGTLRRAWCDLSAAYHNIARKAALATIQSMFGDGKFEKEFMLNFDRNYKQHRTLARQ